MIVDLAALNTYSSTVAHSLTDRKVLTCFAASLETDLDRTVTTQIVRMRRSKCDELAFELLNFHLRTGKRWSQS